MINFKDKSTDSKFFYDAFLELKAKGCLWFRLHGEDNPLNGSLRRTYLYEVRKLDLDDSLTKEEQAEKAKTWILNFLHIQKFEVYYYSNYANKMKNSEFTSFEWIPGYTGYTDNIFDMNKIYTKKEKSSCKDANNEFIKAGDVVVGMTGRKPPYHQVVGTVDVVFMEKYAVRNKERVKIKPLDCFKQFDRDIVIVDTTDVMIINNGMLSEIVAARLTAK